MVTLGGFAVFSDSGFLYGVGGGTTRALVDLYSQKVLSTYMVEWNHYYDLGKYAS